MKKRVLSGLFALALLVAAGYGVSQTMKNEANLSDLALMNVEALANGEFPDLPHMCIHDCQPCWCYIPPIDVDPVGHWIYPARYYY
ncbi:hypothetical protein D7D25_17460 [Proteiniphilum sp. X52]|nr:hypothetical protein D7D25_17460 [Proteiniphilum sp. X52]